MAIPEKEILKKDVSCSLTACMRHQGINYYQNSKTVNIAPVVLISSCPTDQSM